MACHRVARLIGQGPTVVEAISAGSVDDVACDGDQALLQYADLMAARLAGMRQDLKGLPPLPDMAEVFDIGERYSHLDIVLSFARKGRASLTELLSSLDLVAGSGLAEDSPEMKAIVQSVIRYSADTPIDWDLILRISNGRFDRIVEGWRRPGDMERRDSLRRIDGECRTLKDTVKDAASLDQALKANPRQALSERLEQILWTMYSSSLWAAVWNTDRAKMRFDLDQLAFALAACRAEHGSYPATLAELVPQYVEEIPRDVFNDEDGELHYRQPGGGFLLYSVGINGKDDDGRSYEDRQTQEDWDDLTVRVEGKR